MIILRKVKYGEADLVIQGLDSFGAKHGFLARSAAKSKKRFGGGVLEPTHYISGTYRESRSAQGLHELKDATLINDFAKLKTDYTRIETALYMVGLIDRLSYEGDVDMQNLFNLLGNSLGAAESCQQLHKLRVQFEFKLLAYLGIFPQWPEGQIFITQRMGESDSIDLTVEDSLILSKRIRQFIEEHFQIRLQ